MKRAALILLLAIVMPLLILLGGGTWLLRTESGTRFALARATSLMGDKLTIESLEGALSGPLSLQGLHYEDDSVVVDLRAAQLDWLPGALLASIVRINDLQLQGLSVALKPTPPDPQKKPPLSRLPVQISLKRLLLEDFSLITAPDAKAILLPRAELEGSWFGDDIQIAHLDVQHELVGAARLAGAMQLKQTGIQLRQLKITGPMILRVDGYLGYTDASDLELAWENLRWPLQGPPQVTSSKGEARVQGTIHDLKFETELALGATAQLKAAGTWRDALVAKLEWTGLAYPLLDPAAPWKSAKGEAQISGLPEAYRFNLKAALNADGIPGQLAAVGSGSLEAVQLQSLELKALSGTTRAAGRIAWAPQLSADLSGSVAGINPALLAPEWPGSINGGFQVQGVSEGSPDLRFKAQLRDSKLRDYTLALDAVGRYSGKSLDFDSFSLRSGASELKASGRALPPFDLKAELSSPDLANLWPGLGGRAQLAAGFRGTLAAPQLSAKGRIDQLAYQQYKVETTTLDAELDAKAASRLALVLSRISIGSPIDRISLNGEGLLKDHRLKLAVQMPQGSAGLTVAGGYEAAKKTWKGQLTGSRLAAGELAPWTLADPATLSVSPTAQWISPACWSSGAAEACLDASRDAVVTRAAFRLENFAVTYFKPLLPPGWNVNAMTLAGTGAVALRGGALSEVNADLQSTAGSLRVQRQTVLSFEPGQLRVQDREGRLTATLNLPLKDGGLNAEVQLGNATALTDRPLSGKLDLRIPDLAWLGLLSGEVESAQGRLEGHYTLSGTPGKAQLDGVAELLDGKFQLSTPGITLTEVKASLRGGDSGALAVEAQAKSGDGEIRVQGSATPGGAVALTVKGQDFQVANTPDARAWVSPDLAFTFAEGVARLSGSVQVPRADITPKKLDTGIGPSSDQIIVKTGSDAPAQPGLRINADLRIDLGDKVKFEGFGLKTRLEGGLNVYEEPGRPTYARGEVRLVEGQYKAYGQDLTIQTGKLLFTGGPVTQPALQLVAVRKPREDIEVGVRVRGVLDAPEFSLYSTPTMPQQQQLSWLVLGRDLEQTAGEDQQLLNDAALALGLTGGDFLAQSLRKGLGIDDISIGAKPGEDAEQAKLTVGKYLSPKLYVAYGFGIFQPGQVFRLLYDIGAGFKVATETGVNSGGDLLYSIERK